VTVTVTDSDWNVMTVGLVDEQTEQSRLSLSCGTLENGVEHIILFKNSNRWRTFGENMQSKILLDFA